MNQFDLLKSHIDAYTRKDGAVVQAHDDSRQAAFTTSPFKHGGFQVKNGGKHHVILDDERFAKHHADVMNAVHAAGKSDAMESAAKEAGKKHLGVNGFKEVGHDDDDFVDTGKVSTKRALEHAYNAGAGGNNPALRVHRDNSVKDAAKHFANFDTLKEGGSDRKDFHDVSKRSLQLALHHAYANGHAAVNTANNGSGSKNK
jgi:hypothetical protein